MYAEDLQQRKSMVTLKLVICANLRFLQATLTYVICVGSVTVLLKCINRCNSIVKYVYLRVCSCMWFT